MPIYDFELSRRQGGDNVFSSFAMTCTCAMQRSIGIRIVASIHNICFKFPLSILFCTCLFIYLLCRVSVKCIGRTFRKQQKKYNIQQTHKSDQEMRGWLKNTIKSPLRPIIIHKCPSKTSFHFNKH